jgi:hypothetical protein
MSEYRYFLQLYCLLLIYNRESIKFLHADGCLFIYAEA